MLELNPANVLTLVRISLIPVLAAVLLSTLPEADLLAAIVFVIASATDALDGWLARRRSQVTQFGKLMDPLADKLLITAALVSLVALYRLDAWVAMVIIAREFAVTGLRMLAVEQGQVVPGERLGQAQDAHPGRDGARADLGRPPGALGRPARLPHGGGHRAVRRRLLLPAAQAVHGRAPAQAAPSSHSRIDT